LAGLFEPCPAAKGAGQTKRQLLSAILHLRLMGKCSLHAISELLSVLGLGQASTAYISQELEGIGSRLGNTPKYEGQAVFLCDEIFCPEPVLVTVEPQSMAILRIEKVVCLDKEAWKAHWQGLGQAGIQSAGFVSDEGSAMREAQKEGYADRPFQADTFHAVAYQLGVIASRLETQAYGAIGKEYERQRVWQGAIQRNHAAIQEQKREAYLEACRASRLAIDKYELFVFLYGHILKQLQVFDPQGSLRNPAQATEETQTALQYMRQLDITGLSAVLNRMNIPILEIFQIIPLVFVKIQN
jgi:hypothetical protein